MKIKIKKLRPDAAIPKYAKNGDAGLDLVAITTKWNDDERSYEYGTGLAIEIPQGFVGFIFPRSSICKKSLMLSNSVGVIDSGYRGEIKFKFKETPIPSGRYFSLYKVGEKIGQLIIVPYPQIELEEVDSLSESERGTDGFGSSGN
jgi:dUTP pyrophosphatase